MWADRGNRPRPVSHPVGRCSVVAVGRCSGVGSCRWPGRCSCSCSGSRSRPPSRPASRSSRRARPSCCSSASRRTRSWRGSPCPAPRARSPCRATGRADTSPPAGRSSRSTSTPGRSPGAARSAADRPRSSALALSPGGETLYAVRGTQLLVLDAQTLVPRTAIELRGEGSALAVSSTGAAAAVVLRSGRVAMVALGTNRLLRHVKLKDALGVAIADNGTTYVTARGRLRVIAPGQHRVRKRAIALPDGAGGALTLSPGRSRLVVGAAPGGQAGAIVDLRHELRAAPRRRQRPRPRRLVPRCQPDRLRRRRLRHGLADQPLLARSDRARRRCPARRRATSSCSRAWR